MSLFAVAPRRTGRCLPAPCSAASRCAAATAASAYRPVAPAPISAGRLGMARTTARRRPASAAGRPARMPAATEITSGPAARSAGASARATAAMMLRLHRQHDHLRATHGRERCRRVTCDAEVAVQRRARWPPAGSATVMGEGARAAAAAGRRSGRAPCCRRRSGRCAGMQAAVMCCILRRGARARTARCRCAPGWRPSAMAASRSPLMPIDKRVEVQARACWPRRAARAAARNAGAAARFGQVEGQHAHQAPQPQPRQCRDRAQQRRRFAGRHAALAGFVGDVHLHADIQRRRRRRALVRQPLGDPQPVDAVHPGEVARHGRASCWPAAGR